MTIFRLGDVLVRELRESDANQMLEWLSDPKVLEYYEGRDRKFTLESIHETFYAQDEEIKCLILSENAPVGYLQFYPIRGDDFAEYDYPATELVTYAIDLFIGERKLWSKGIGTRALSGCIAYLRDVMKARIVLIDPHASNARAIHVYEKVGFRKIKLLSGHELHEGSYRDCWLMEYKIT